ncbi:MAG: PTS sugar transporter subunit IIB [Coriobacteriaceae bacterium]|uniref:PTS system mannose/fructose/N-acetylgalactosamine-transporter subunit IIB n=1 Tax=Tractidigestivibacter sp. TaxID=2847320 RepID=UPI002A7FBE9E|nr:PTS sugar transporter subunit IIB [Tractidigestivibacter sp.]MCI6549108.1 PTS sugar transporter subunit IIB [Coriobacteriaceae bacterium]MDY4535161.1 PTS sugar transporter subunit IIB [Tractidigestivibacter sp.]
MAVVLARVDDRVIHGQTTTRWMAVKPADAILVISDKIAADQLRCKVLKAAAGTLKLGIYTLAQGPQALERAQASAKKFFVISDSIRNFMDLTKAGGDYGGVLNVGNLNATREGTKNMGNTVMLNDEDCAALDELEAAGIDIQFQLLPDDSVRTWPSLKAKYQSM